jgi:hypothetical protein
MVSFHDEHGIGAVSPILPREQLVGLVRELLAQAQNRGITLELQAPDWVKVELGERKR